jgi:hypothetical protein
VDGTDPWLGSAASPSSAPDRRRALSTHHLVSWIAAPLDHVRANSWDRRPSGASSGAGRSLPAPRIDERTDTELEAVSRQGVFRAPGTLPGDASLFPGLAHHGRCPPGRGRRPGDVHALSRGPCSLPGGGRRGRLARPRGDPHRDRHPEEEARPEAARGGPLGSQGRDGKPRPRGPPQGGGGAARAVPRRALARDESGGVASRGGGPEHTRRGRVPREHALHGEPPDPVGAREAPGGTVASEPGPRARPVRGGPPAAAAPGRPSRRSPGAPRSPGARGPRGLGVYRRPLGPVHRRGKGDPYRWGPSPHC